jgi:hypothetical protein
MPSLLFAQITSKPIPSTIIFICAKLAPSRSQQSRGLRHELSSLAWMLGSWVRIPLKVWMSVWVHSLFMLFCVEVEALRWSDPLSKESYRFCIGPRNWKIGQGPTKGCRAIIIIIQFLLFMCRVNSYKAKYRHSTVWIQVITLWTNTT